MKSRIRKLLKIFLFFCAAFIVGFRFSLQIRLDPSVHRH